MKPATTPCATCPHAHPEQPEAAHFPEVWQAVRDAARAGDRVPCHQSFPDDWDGDESQLRWCAGVTRA